MKDLYPPPLASNVKMSTDITGILSNPAELAALCEVNEGTGPLVLTWVMLTVSTTIVSLRVLIRYHSRNLGWDDYTIVLSQVCRSTTLNSQIIA